MTARSSTISCRCLTRPKPLSQVADHIDEAQNALGRTILLENPSTYVAFAESTMAETDFLRELARRTGCGLLLDINNVFVSATNQGYDPHRYLADFPLQAVGEIHLAGYAEDQDDAGLPLLIDAHNSPVRDAVWTLYAAAIRRLGATPTLIEWDNDLPAWPALLGEARRAERDDGSRSAAGFGTRRCRLRRRSRRSLRRSPIPPRRRPRQRADGSARLTRADSRCTATTSPSA